MPQRLDEFNKMFLYTETNPENIISARKGAYFFRKGNEFFFNADGNFDATWEKLPYRTVIIPPPPLTKIIKFEYPTELWIKNSDGLYDDFGKLLPKTDWKFLSYNTDVFARTSLYKTIRWLFPAPTNSYDSRGNNNSRSYDDNYFYAKIGGLWYRTPLTSFTSPGDATTDTPFWTNNLPFVDAPRYNPVPPNSGYPGFDGDQSYDADFFYVKTGIWKRSSLLMFTDTSKMTLF